MKLHLFIKNRYRFKRNVKNQLTKSAFTLAIQKNMWYNYIAVIGAQYETLTLCFQRADESLQSLCFIIRKENECAGVCCFIIAPINDIFFEKELLQHVKDRF